MYGSSTEYKIPYIDCLFICMSCFTVTGLATINLSTLSAFQQSILFVLEVTGSLVRFSGSGEALTVDLCLDHHDRRPIVGSASLYDG